MSKPTPEPAREPYIAEAYWDTRYRTFDITASGNRDLPFDYNIWLYKLKSKKVRDAFRKYRLDPKTIRILELGAGTGEYVDLWKRLGVQSVEGVDISATSVQGLAERFPEYRFSKEDLSDPTMVERHPGPFGLLTAFGVLYHIIDDEAYSAALRHANRMADAKSLFFYTDLLVHGPEEVHGYMKYRSLIKVTEALTRNGFEIIERIPVYFTMTKAVDVATPKAAKFHHNLWGALGPRIRSRPRLMGPLLFAVDSLLGMVCKEGPSLEMLICRKIISVQPTGI